MSQLTRALFWKSYFRIYDALCRIRPYQRSIERGVQLLGVRRGEKYLDLACGTGNSSRAIKDKGGLVVGLDSSAFGLELASRKFPAIKFVQGDFNRRLPFENGEFSGVFAHNALYLAGDPVRTIGEIHRVLRFQGNLVMSNPVPKANPLAIVKENIRLRYLESPRSVVGASAETVILFLIFLPFQIALKSRGGGAANFWSRQQWENAVRTAAEKGSRFAVEAVEPSYAGQNTTFALKKG